MVQSEHGLAICCLFIFAPLAANCAEVEIFREKPDSVFYTSTGNLLFVYDDGQTRLVEITSRTEGVVRRTFLEDVGKELINKWFCTAHDEVIGISRSGTVFFWNPYTGKKLGSLSLSTPKAVRGRIYLAGGREPFLMSSYFILEDAVYDEKHNIIYMLTQNALYRIKHCGAEVSQFEFFTRCSEQQPCPQYTKVLDNGGLCYTRFRDGKSTVFITEPSNGRITRVGDIENEVVSVHVTSEYLYFLSASTAKGEKAGPHLASAGNYMLTVYKKRSFEKLRTVSISGAPVRAFALNDGFYYILSNGKKPSATHAMIYRIDPNGNIYEKAMEGVPIFGRRYLSDNWTLGTSFLYCRNFVYITMDFHVICEVLP